MNELSRAVITILGNAEPRQIMNKQNIAKTIYSQKASLETEQMRIQIDVEVDGPNMAYRVGESFDWDLAADIQPGQYGRPELARKKTLRPRSAEPAKLAAAK